MGTPSVTICDVGPRDGLQNDALVLDPVVRAELVDRLAATGIPRVEAVSFVNPARVPQMAGAEEVVQAIERRPGVIYAGLALNERGYDRFAATGLDEVHFAFAATETFNQRNQGASVADSLATASRIVERAHADGRRATVTIGASFGCPFEGRVDPGRVIEIAAELSEARPDELVLADTIGVGVPRQVRRLVPDAVALGIPVGRSPAQHAEHRLCERHHRSRIGRDDARRLRRRDRRLPVRTAGDGEHRHRGPRLPPARRGDPNGHRPRSARHGC